MRENRDFKGVWIPAKIWLNTDLSAVDKCLLAEIDSLDNAKHCFATNAYFAEFLGVSEPTVSRSISKLLELDLIRIVSFDGRRRVLASNLIKMTTLPNQNDKAALSKKQGSIGKKIRQPNQNDMRINTESNSGSNTANKSLTTRETQERDFLETPYEVISALKPEKATATAKPASHTKIVSFSEPLCETSDFTIREYWAMWLQAWEGAGLTLTTLQRNGADGRTRVEFHRLTPIQCDAIKEHLPTLFANRENKFWGTPEKYLTELKFMQPIAKSNVKASITQKSDDRITHYKSVSEQLRAELAAKLSSKQ